MFVLPMTMASHHALAQEVTITLNPGWTWVSYPRADTLDIVTALQFVPSTNGDMIKSQNTYSTYLNGMWIGNLQQLIPGKGLMYKSMNSNAINFVFGASSIPSVTTSEVGSIGQTTATGGGVVMASGGETVTERGICWSTSHNPTIGGSHASNGAGTGTFSINMTGLAANTIYYVRAYATNSKGTAYGNEVSFTTILIPEYNVSLSANPSNGGTASGGGTYQQWQTCTVTATANTGYTFTNWTENGVQVSTNANYSFTVMSNRTLVANFAIQVTLPVVTTDQVTDITQTTATCGGNVTDDGNATVTARGICWDTNQNPTIANNHTTDGSGTGSFNSSMTGLTASTTYYVRAYATNSAGTAYGNEVSFTTEAEQPQAPVGAINGLFSVSANRQVYFSRGNLQYRALVHQWRFAPHQYDIIGEGNNSISETYEGWIDLFGWGTSGFDHGAFAYQPWSISQSNHSYYAYGSSDYDLFSQTGKADWGYNRISNGGNQLHKWRTLTSSEWEYVLFSRPGIRFAKARVYGVDGLILLPDNWNSSVYWLNNTNNAGANYTSNTINANQWNNILEPAGAVFLPVAGMRVGSLVNGFTTTAAYWSSTHFSFLCYDMWFSNSKIEINTSYRYYGRSVRLVRNAE